MFKVVIRCAKCYSNNWIEKPKDKRNNSIPKYKDLECGNCGASYCAKNRYWSWEDDNPQQVFKINTN